MRDARRISVTAHIDEGNRAQPEFNPDAPDTISPAGIIPAGGLQTAMTRPA